jgi:uncharacterized protein
MQITLHGGEPTLIGAARLKRMIASAREQLGPRLSRIAMQTNGTLIDEAWVDVLKQCDVQTSISVDGPAHVHDSVRVDHFGRGSHAATLRGIKLLQAAGIFGGVITVINPAQSGIECYRFLRSEGIDHMNFLPPDATHDTKSSLYGAFGETPVADYLIPIFDAWYEEDNPQINIRLFMSILTMLLGGEPAVDSLGNPQMSYLIIESDGSIQALDTLRICQEGLPDTGLNVSTHGFDDLAMGFPLAHRLVHEGIPSCTTCRRCPEHRVCGGGYLPHRYSRLSAFDNPSVWCSDIMKLLRHIRRKTGIEHVALN